MDLYRQALITHPDLPPYPHMVFTVVPPKGVEEVLASALTESAKQASIQYVLGGMYGDSFVAIAKRLDPPAPQQEVEDDGIEQSQGAAPRTTSSGGQGPMEPMGLAAADGQSTEAPIPGPEIPAEAIRTEGEHHILSPQSLLIGCPVLEVLSAPAPGESDGERGPAEGQGSDGGQAGQ